MENNDTNRNPWASINIEARSGRKSSKIIDNRFPNNFKKSSSIVTCNLCHVLLLKSQTLHHFKSLHNNKLAKKCSKFIIPYKAIEIYDLICEHKAKKLMSKKSNHSNESVEIFQLKRKKIDLCKGKEISKIASKLPKQTSHVNKVMLSNGTLNKEESKMENKLENHVANNNNDKIPKEAKLSTKRSEKNPLMEFTKTEIKATNPCVSSKRDLDYHQNTNDLKLNIKVNSNGIISSNTKVESNIFDQMSSLCDKPSNDKVHIPQSASCKDVLVKQMAIDTVYGCTIFTDEHNNSILIDNDNNDLEDFDCCESSISNDSAYYSLPNTTIANSLCAPHPRKSNNFYESTLVPPLVTAYQFSATNNKPSFINSTSDTKQYFKPDTTSMVVTKNCTSNSVLSTKSNVKHRFYVSSHSNKNMFNSIRKSSDTRVPIANGLLTESSEYNSDTQNSSFLNVTTEKRDFLNIENNVSSDINNQLNMMGSSADEEEEMSVNSLDLYDCRPLIRQSLLNYNYWECIQENGIKNHLFIPKRLSWNYVKSRFKTFSHLYTDKPKYSPDLMIHQPEYIPTTSHSTISSNPLLSSYTLESIVNDTYSQPDNNHSGILPDYPFPDRNQMSFQQRLLERGVISQRDIAKSQRCLSLSNPTIIKKNVKLNSNKQAFVDGRKVFVNKAIPLKNRIVGQIDQGIGGSHSNGNKASYSQYVDPVMKDGSKSRSTILVENNFDILPNSVLNSKRQSWHDTARLSVNHNVNANIATFQELCLSQNNNPKSCGTIVIGSNSGFNTILSHLDNNSDSHISGYNFQSNSSLLQITNSSLNSVVSAQNILSKDSICFPQPFTRKYIGHSIGNAINRYNNCAQNFANHSNVIHTNFDR